MINSKNYKDKETAEYFVNTYSDKILRICISYSLTKEDAFDICQNIYIKLMNKKIFFNDENHEKSYIIKMAINECKDILKSNNYKNKLNIIDYTNLKTNTENYEYKETIEIIKNLPIKYREAIYFCYIEGLSSEETSKIIGVSASAIRKRLSRAKEMLKNNMEVQYE